MLSDRGIKVSLGSIEGGSSLKEQLVCADSAPSNGAYETSSSWLSTLPREVQLLGELIECPKIVKAASVVYTTTSVMLVVFYALRIVHVTEQGVPGSRVLHYALDICQDTAYVLMPFITYRYLKSFFSDADVPVLFSAAVTAKSSLRFQFVVVCRTNFLIMTIAYVSFIAYSGAYAIQIAISCVSVLYLYPFCLLYSLSVCIMLAHKANATHFCDTVRQSRVNLDLMVQEKALDISHSFACGKTETLLNVDQSRLNIEFFGMYARYRILHAMCLKTSEKRGSYLLLIHILAILFGLTTVWTIYTGDQLIAASIAYFLCTLFIILQLGLSVTAANEVGHIVCRELSTYVLSIPQLFDGSSERYNNAPAVLLMSCMEYSKLEVLFFGNFALRSRHLLAIMGTFIGALIPAAAFGITSSS